HRSTGHSSRMSSGVLMCQYPGRPTGHRVQTLMTELWQDGSFNTAAGERSEICADLCDRTIAAWNASPARLHAGLFDPNTLVCLDDSSAETTAECETERRDEFPERQGCAVKGLCF